MEVVDVEDSGDCGEGGADVGERDGAGRSFEEDIEGLADDGGGTPEDHAGDDYGEDGIDPECAGEEDARASGDDGGGGECVAEHVQEDGADVDVAGELPEQGGDGAVHQDAGGGDVHHKARLNGDRVGETVDGGDGDPAGKDDESKGVDKGREDAGALVAEGFVGGGGAALQVDGDEAEAERKEVGKVVAGFGKQCEGVGAQAEVEGREDVKQSQAERELEDALDAGLRRVGFGVDVHLSSVSVCGDGSWGCPRAVDSVVERSELCGWCGRRCRSFDCVARKAVSYT